MTLTTSLFLFEWLARERTVQESTTTIFSTVRKLLRLHSILHSCLIRRINRRNAVVCLKAAVAIDHPHYYEYLDTLSRNRLIIIAIIVGTLRVVVTDQITVHPNQIERIVWNLPVFVWNLAGSWLQPWNPIIWPFAFLKRYFFSRRSSWWTKTTTTMVRSSSLFP